MISPAEIKAQALNWWKPFLLSVVHEEDFFPRRINRVGRVKPGDIPRRFGLLKQEIDLLYQQSKLSTGVGYSVISEEQNFRRAGTHILPVAIEFETEEDFVAFTGKRSEWRRFQNNLRLICCSIPALRRWSALNCLWLTQMHTDWPSILKVCRYFLEHPRPDVYIRQLPVEVHTKFMEENSGLLISLLDFLMPEHIRNNNTFKISERYYLRYDQPLIRLRYLNANDSCTGFSDISLPVSDFETLQPVVENVIITENKMNFLTLPILHSTLAIWSGGGFQVGLLKNAPWLLEKKIFYWGDIDEHGFQILNQLRGYYPATMSVMMDRATFETFRHLAGVGARSLSSVLDKLTEGELELFFYLKTQEHNRLEQEKIPQAFVDMELLKLPGLIF